MISSSIAETMTPALVEARVAGKRAGYPVLALARVLLVASLLAAPLAFGAVEPWAWTSLTVLAFLALLLWGIGCVQQSVVKIFWSPLYLPAALLLLLGVIQFFGNLTVDRIATREALLKLVTDLIIFFLAGQLWASSSKNMRRSFGIVITVYAFSLSLIAILQFFSGSTYTYFNYWTLHSIWGAFGTYVNRNHYAGLMEMLIPIVAVNALSPSRGPSRRSFLGFAALLPIASSLLTGSRGGFVALLAEIVILAAILSKSGSFAARRNLLTFGVLGITVVAILFFWMDPGEVSKRLGGVFNRTISSTLSGEEREAVALDCLRILRDHPWVGTGLGSFETVYPGYQSLPNEDIWQHAHNDYAEALAETGLAGGVLIVSALLMFFSLAFRNLSARLSQHGGWIQLGAALGCCGLLVHSYFDFNLRIPANAMWFAVCVGLGSSMITSSPSPERGDRRDNMTPKRSVQGGVSLAGDS
jgi:O-antigen ligase